MVSPLLRDRRGAAAVEFAAVVGAFLIVVLLLLETGWQVAVAAALESGGREASRWASTGQAPAAGETSTGHVTGLVLNGSGLPLRAAGLTVTADSFASFAAVATPAAAKSGLGGPGDVVRYTIVYRSPPLTPFGRALMPLGLLQHQLVLLVKNEPYPAS